MVTAGAPILNALGAVWHTVGQGLFHLSQPWDVLSPISHTAGEQTSDVKSFAQEHTARKR